ncbi:crossover junction endodeoxyribonuclease RuvC [Verrucomicrobiota bacterium sgz303538]
MSSVTAVSVNRVLAIDPSLRSTGYAVLERAGAGKLRAVTYGIIKNSDRMLQSGCLVAIRERVADLIAEHRPDCAAFEAIIYVQSFRTAIIMGCARGAALLAAAEKGLPIYEYAPRRVKQAIVGRGGAEKAQVGFMVRALLGLTENPPADAADALAIGMTHFQASDTIRSGIGELERI